jgi:hypothetical protein
MQSPSELQKQQLENQLLRARTTSLQTDTRKDQAVLDSQTSIGQLIGQALEQRRATVAPVTQPAFVGPVRPANRARQEAAFADDSFAGRLAQAGSGLTGSPQDLANLIRFMTANTPSATDAQVVRAQAGAGQRLGVNQAVSLPGQANVAQRNQTNRLVQDAAKIAATPETFSQVRGRAATATIDAEQPGGTAVTPDQRIIALGAQSFGSPLERVADPASETGITLTPRADAAGQPGVAPSAVNRADVTGITSAIRTQSQQTLASINTSRNIVRIMEPLAADPSNFGAAGFMKQTVQNAQQAGDAFANQLAAYGVNLRAEIQGHNAGFEEEDALDPGIFDSGLPQFQFLKNLLTYRLALINNPDGRISTPDYDNAKRTLGGRIGVFSFDNSKQFLANLKAFEQFMDIEERNQQGLLRGDFQAQANAAVPQAFQGTQPAAPPAQSTGEVLRFDAQGNLIQ